MDERFRRCEKCEWLLPRRSLCCYNPPKVFQGTTYSKTEYPAVNKDGFCSKWEPKWADNPHIKAQWEKFKTSLGLQT